MESPNVVTFCENGQHIVTGGFATDRMIQIFDLNKPGRDALHTVKLGKTRKSKDGQKGLVSAITSASRNLSGTTTATGTPYHNLLAIGTYSPGSIYLYDTRCYKAGDVSTIMTAATISGTCVVGHGKSHGRKRKHFRLEETNGDGGGDENGDDILFNFSAAKIKWYQNRARGGVTQLQFSPNDHLLYSASRRSDAVLAWDIRKLSSLETSPLSVHCPGIASYKTDSDTNQRLEFTFCQQNNKQQLWIGGRDACVRVYDCQSQRLIETIDIATERQGNDGNAVNGVSLFQPSNTQSKALMAVSVGSRTFPTEQDYCSSTDDDDDDIKMRITPAAASPGPGGLQMYEVSSKP